MGFGERKAYFLSIRPNPKFATWFGKKKHPLVEDKLVHTNYPRCGNLRIKSLVWKFNNLVVLIVIILVLIGN